MLYLSYNVGMIYWISIWVVVLDQLSKGWVVSHMKTGQSIPVMPFWNLYLTHNKGVSFSMMTSDSPLMPWLLAGFSVAVCGMLVGWMRHEANRITRIGLALVIGGAVGNVIDRVRAGSVIDFLDFYIGDWHWPAFNIADSAICIGVGLILLSSFKKKESV